MQDTQQLLEFLIPIERALALAVIGAIAVRARRRGLRWWPYVLVALAGLIVVGLTSFFAGLGLWIVPLRWAWLGGLFLYVERFTRGGQRMTGNWQCPDCLCFNEPATLNCACGFAQPAPKDEPA